MVLEKQEQRYRIALIAKDDAFYFNRKRLIGEEGTAWNLISKPGGWAYCDFNFDKFIPALGVKAVTFFKVLLKKLPPKETQNAET